MANRIINCQNTLCRSEVRESMAVNHCMYKGMHAKNTLAPNDSA
jgi:hypothetical protein